MDSAHQQRSLGSTGRHFPPKVVRRGPQSPKDFPEEAKFLPDCHYTAHLLLRSPICREAKHLRAQSSSFPLNRSILTAY